VGIKEEGIVMSSAGTKKTACAKTTPKKIIITIVSDAIKNIFLFLFILLLDKKC
jgi:hypothetical protein